MAALVLREKHKISNPGVWSSRVLCTGRLNGKNRLIEAPEKRKWLSDIKEAELWDIL